MKDEGMGTLEGMASESRDKLLGIMELDDFRDYAYPGFMRERVYRAENELAKLIMDIKTWRQIEDDTP